MTAPHETTVYFKGDMADEEKRWDHWEASETAEHRLASVHGLWLNDNTAVKVFRPEPNGIGPLTDEIVAEIEAAVVAEAKRREIAVQSIVYLLRYGTREIQAHAWFELAANNEGTEQIL